MDDAAREREALVFVVNCLLVTDSIDAPIPSHGECPGAILEGAQAKAEAWQLSRLGDAPGVDDGFGRSRRRLPVEPLYELLLSHGCRLRVPSQLVPAVFAKCVRKDRDQLSQLVAHFAREDRNRQRSEPPERRAGVEGAYSWVVDAGSLDKPNALQRLARLRIGSCIVLAAQAIKLDHGRAVALVLRGRCDQATATAALVDLSRPDKIAARVPEGGQIGLVEQRLENLKHLVRTCGEDYLPISEIAERVGFTRKNQEDALRSRLRRWRNTPPAEGFKAVEDRECRAPWYLYQPRFVREEISALIHHYGAD